MEMSLLKNHFTEFAVEQLCRAFLIFSNRSFQINRTINENFYDSKQISKIFSFLQCTVSKSKLQSIFGVHYCR